MSEAKRVNKMIDFNHRCQHLPKSKLANYRWLSITNWHSPVPVQISMWPPCRENAPSFKPSHHDLDPVSASSWSSHELGCNGFGPCLNSDSSLPDGFCTCPEVDVRWTVSGPSLPPHTMSSFVFFPFTPGETADGSAHSSWDPASHSAFWF